MKGSCPYCAEGIDADATRCAACGSELVKVCPFCAESISSIETVCTLCRSDLSAPTGQRPAPVVARGRSGEERGILITILGGFITLGLYGFVVLYNQAKEIQAHSGAKVNPVRDIVWSFLSWGLTLGTVPVGIYYMMYRYPKTLMETCLTEEIPCRDVITPCLLLSIIMSVSLLVMAPKLYCIALAFPLWVVSIAVFQHEMNLHWRAHKQLA